MTYSEIVSLLSAQMVPRDDEESSQMIPMLEKFVNQESGADESNYDMDGHDMDMDDHHENEMDDQHDIREDTDHGAAWTW